MIPGQGVRAANVLFDAVISQDTSASEETNRQSMTLALMALTGGDDDEDQFSSDSAAAGAPDVGDITGSAIISIAWLARHLADATNSSTENVIADLRTFVDAHH